MRKHPMIGQRVLDAAPALGQVAEAGPLDPRALGRRAATPTASPAATSRSAPA